MKIHAIQTGSVLVRPSQQVGRGRGLQRMLHVLRDEEWTEPLPIYAWAIEHPEGVIVVDTGETSATADPGYFPAWHPYYRRAVAMDVSPEQEVGPQLRELGITPSDVRKVVMTHLHTDHAGGLKHFPDAEILVEPNAYRHARGAAGRLRGFLPHRWPDGFNPSPLELRNEPIGLFYRSLRLTSSGDVAVVSTPGHTPHHISVVVFGPDHAFFLAGDTSYTQDAMLKGAVDGVAPDARVAAATLAKVRRFAAKVPTVYLPSHDQDAAVRLARKEVVPSSLLSKVDFSRTSPLAGDRSEMVNEEAGTR